MDTIITFEEGVSFVRARLVDAFLDNISRDALRETRLITTNDFAPSYECLYKMCTQAGGDCSEHVYNWYCELLSTFITDKLIPRLSEATTNSDASAYFEAIGMMWNRYRLALRGLSNVFHYLNNYYATSSTVSDKKPLKLVVKGYEIFYRVAFSSNANDLSRRIIQHLITELTGERGDLIGGINSLKQIIQLYISVGFILNSKNPLELYSESIEKPYTCAVVEHYARSRESLRRSNSLCGYLSAVKKREDDIRKQCDEYLHEGTTSGVLGAYTHYMIYDYKEELLSPIEPVRLMFINNETSNLKLLYDSFRGNESCVGMIVSVAHDLILIDGKEAQIIQTTKTTAPMVKSEEIVIGRLISLYKKYNNIFIECFERNVAMYKSIRAAFETLMNVDTKYGLTHALAFCLDAALRRSDYLIDAADMIELYAFIRDKDIFELDYQDYLARRLIDGSSASDQTERQTIAAIKAKCGYAFARKMEGMFSDIAASKDLYRMYMRETKAAYTCFDARVLTKTYWPSDEACNFKVPPELQAMYNSFMTYYLNKHNGRKLTFSIERGSADLKVAFPSGTKELCVSPAMMLIMLQFNRDTVLTCEQIVKATNIRREVLAPHLLGLAHPRLKVLLKTPPKKELLDTDVFRINNNFSHKLYRIKVSTVKINEVAVSVSERTDNPNRRYQVDAAVVRIMKARRRMRYIDLQSEVVKQLMARFTPEVKLIKERIECLIESEYMMRDENDRATLNYVA